MSRRRRGEPRPERGRRRRRSSRRAEGSVDAAEPSSGLTGTTLVIRGLIVLAVVAAVAGTTVVGVVTRGGDVGGGSSEAQQRQNARPKPQESATTQKVRGPVLAKSPPVAIQIRSAGIQVRLLTLGLQPDGTIEVPPEESADQPGWYEASPTPGEPGPCVIIGQAAQTKGMPRPVFRDLGKVKPGATVEVAREDKMIAMFRVDKVKRYPVTHFPADEVYGTVDYAGLRLITYTPPSSSPGDDATNVVVYASLEKSRAGG